MYDDFASKFRFAHPPLATEICPLAPAIENKPTGASPPVQLQAWARRVAAWGEALNAAAAPPLSPVDCAAPGACGALERVTLVPHGSTLLRITEFPFTSA